MKKLFVVILILILIQVACNLPLAATAQATPSLPAATETIAPLPASTDVPVSLSTPLADTDTLGVTQTAITTETATSTAIMTETLTPTVTLTETSTTMNLFSDVVLSSEIVSPSCEPKSVRFEVTPADSRVYSVVLFIRLHYKTEGDRTNWSDGVAMRPVGGKFVYDLKASSISNFNKYKDPVAWIQFQLVAIDSGRTIIGRSEVFTDKLTITSICS